MRGVLIEEMDKLFGGNQGESDLRRILAIRLGPVPHDDVDALFDEKLVTVPKSVV
jgi:hypothetical protein